MKKYIKPITEIVNVQLFGSVLGGVDVVPGSPGVEEGDAKEQGGLWGDVDDEDTWTGSKGVDLWGSDEDEEEW